MLFKKRPTNEPRRTRRTASAEGLGGQPVFSYHSRSAARSEPGAARRASKSLWTASGQPAKPRTRPRSRFRRIIVLAATAGVLVLAVNALLLGDNPKIVAVAGDSGRQLLLRDIQMYQKSAKNALGATWANSNKITVDTAHIAAGIKKQHPELDGVSVTLPLFGRQPVVHVRPAKPALLLKSGTSIFVVSQSGRAVLDARQVHQAEKLRLPLVEDQSGLPTTLGSTVLPSDNVEFITEVIGQLKAKKIKATQIVLPAGASEMDIRIEGQPYFVKFNLRGDARAEAGTFLAVKQHLERENNPPGSYIDVRVENKAYYR